MNKPCAPYIRGRSTTLEYKIGFFFNPTEKVIGIIIIDLDELKLFVYICICSSKIPYKLLKTVIEWSNVDTLIRTL